MVQRSAPPSRRIAHKGNPCKSNKHSRNKPIFKCNKRGNRNRDKFAPSPVSNQFASQARQALPGRNPLGLVS